ncbi:MAG: hypothetical protein LW809_00155 [Vampirovibrionales bacterium]|jgi:hypothetical protein|nr:hypothetical protein [Vampirovibrionales bacterium]
MNPHKKKPVPPTDKNFDASLGMRYAEELRQRQNAGGFGIFNQSSHSLEARELLMSDMVMQGLNNLALMTIRLQREPIQNLQSIPIRAEQS